jgi:arylamine N-acetyltransferase
VCISWLLIQPDNKAHPGLLGHTWPLRIHFGIVIDTNIRALVVDSAQAGPPSAGEGGARDSYRATTCPVKLVRCVQYSADQRGEHRRLSACRSEFEETMSCNLTYIIIAHSECHSTFRTAMSMCTDSQRAALASAAGNALYRRRNSASTVQRHRLDDFHFFLSFKQALGIDGCFLLNIMALKLSYSRAQSALRT